MVELSDLRGLHKFTYLMPYTFFIILKEHLEKFYGWTGPADLERFFKHAPTQRNVAPKNIAASLQNPVSKTTNIIVWLNYYFLHYSNR